MTPDDRLKAGKLLEKLISELESQGYVLKSGAVISKTTLGEALGRKPPYDTIQKWCKGRGFSRINQELVESYLDKPGFFSGGGKSATRVDSHAAGRIVKDAREFAGYTPEQFAKALRLKGGVEELARIEAGKQEIDPDTREQVASLFRVSQEDFFQDGRYPTPGGAGVENKAIATLLDAAGVTALDQRLHFARLVRAGDLNADAARAVLQAFVKVSRPTPKPGPRLAR